MKSTGAQSVCHVNKTGHGCSLFLTSKQTTMFCSTPEVCFSCFAPGLSLTFGRTISVSALKASLSQHRPRQPHTAAFLAKMMFSTTSASAATTIFYQRFTSDKNSLCLCHVERNTVTIHEGYGEISLPCFSAHEYQSSSSRAR